MKIQHLGGANFENSTLAGTIQLLTIYRLINYFNGNHGCFNFGENRFGNASVLLSKVVFIGTDESLAMFVVYSNKSKGC